MAITEETLVLQKTRELCEALLEQPEFKVIRQQIDRFMANDEARSLYDSLNEKGEYLHHKQHQGVALSEQEIAGYEKDRTTFFSNSVAKDFINAQEEMRKLQDAISQYVGKTFELGRIPTEDDLNGGGCGTGCGCHH
jgi:cell fate (sporulation/competence/biofilm development) regulator YlbF (YheA/YmcA/DUF963 family)